MRARSRYNAIWRWHFYAGLFCVPFVLLLAVTGSIYLFKPQIDAWEDRPYNALAITGKPAPVGAQVDAALAAVPGSAFIAYRLPDEADDAAQILVGDAGGAVRVYVHPETTGVLHRVREADRLANVVKRIHGELLLGDRGALLVELAACWAIMMIVTGLFLWWPRGGPAGLLWPRLRAGGRVFWRDVHAVTGVWISVLALFLLISGLPWTTVWGGAFKAANNWAKGPAAGEQAWASGRAADPHAHHHGDPADHGVPAPPPAVALEAMVATTRALGLPPPVLIAAPSAGFPRSDEWTARSETQNRPLRTTLTLDPATGAVLDRKDFGDQSAADRIVGYGVAAHEGQLFGPANQLLGALTAAGLVALSLSGYVLWWKRRPAGRLGAPPAADGRPPRGLLALMLLLGLMLPLMGLSLILVALLERLLLARIAPVRAWLGLRPPRRPERPQPERQGVTP